MKRLSIIKRVLAVGLIFLLSINSFAAVISDNDGSAFVTKAEFDALKSSFAKQIDDYNSSIDGKIDGAIASYLAGITLSTLPEDNIEKINYAAGGTLWALNKIPSLGEAVMTPQLQISGTRHYTLNTGNNSFDGLLMNCLWSASDGMLRVVTFQQKIGHNVFGNWQQHIGWNSNTAGSTTLVKWVNINMGAWNIINDFNDNSHFTNVKNNYMSVSDVSEVGAGARWIYKKDLNGNNYLYHNDTKIFPYIKVSPWLHVYKDVFSNAATFQSAKITDPSSSVVNVADSQTIDTTSILNDYGSFNDGTKYGDNDTHNGNYWSGSVSIIEENDGVDYRKCFFAKNTTTNIYANAIDDALEYLPAEVITKTLPKSYFNEIYYTGEGQNIGQYYQSAYDIKVNKLKYKATQFTMNSFINYPATQAFGNIVKNGNGIPLFKSVSENPSQKISIKFKTDDNSHKSVYFIISDGPFKDGAIDTANGYTKIYESTNTNIDNEVEFTISTLDKKQYWINFYNSDDGYAAAIETISYR